MRALLINPPVLAADPYQVDVYAEPIPYGLLQIATLLEQQGVRTQAIDMMGYLDGGFERAFDADRVFARLRCGNSSWRGITRPVWLYGKDFAWLEERLAQVEEPDEVLVTCAISFNYPPAFEVIRRVRARFPRARIRFGGFYPTMYTEHARQSGADEVFVGRFEEADAVSARLDLWDRPPTVWLFRLMAGCRYKCSFCLNAASPPVTLGDPRAVASGIARVHREYGTREFANWDPNVMLQKESLTVFLEEMIRLDLDLGFKWEMGIQPNRLDKDTAELMKAAGTLAMSISFESSDPEMIRRFRKSSRLDAALRALEVAGEAGFDLSRFHCSFIIGVPGESLRHVFRTHLLILKYGGNPNPFPLTPSPGTLEHERHAPLLAGKDHHELNGHLWPLLGSVEEIERYDTILKVVSSNDVALARRHAAALPDFAREVFEKEVDAVFGSGGGGTAFFGAHRAGPRPRALATPPMLSLPAALHAMCLTCVDRAFCTEKGAPMRPDAPACHRERRGTTLPVLADLFAHLRADLARPLADRLARQEEAMWRHLEALQRDFANTCEPSLSFDGARWHKYRYSYGFHDGVPATWPEDLATARAWFSMLSPQAAIVADDLLGILKPPLARQLLVGAHARASASPGNGQAALRLKLYFRLPPGAAKAKRRLIESMARGRALPDPLIRQAAALHLVGFDFSAAGVRALKCYFHHPTMTAASLLAGLDEHSLFAELSRKRRPATWQDVVSIARLGDAAAPVDTEVDLHAARNNLTLADLGECAAPRGNLPPLDEVIALFARFPLALSRISTPWRPQPDARPDPAKKMNLYYLLPG